MASPTVTIFHNPACGTSRNTLALIREAGVEPDVVEYLKAGWSADQLRALFAKMGVSAKDALRVRGADAEERGLTSPDASDESIIQAMVENPALVNRPIVESDLGAALCRPVEAVVPLLPPAAREALRNKGVTEEGV